MELKWWTGWYRRDSSCTRGPTKLWRHRRKRNSTSGVWRVSARRCWSVCCSSTLNRTLSPSISSLKPTRITVFFNSSILLNNWISEVNWFNWWQWGNQILPASGHESGSGIQPSGQFRFRHDADQSGVKVHCSSRRRRRRRRSCDAQDQVFAARERK